MYYDSVYNQTVQKLKNVGIACRRMQIYESKFALILQYLKMSLEFANIWDQLNMLWATQVSELDFSIKHRQYRYVWRLWKVTSRSHYRVDAV